MTETDGRADDTAAIAAYAAHHRLSEEAAEAEWRFITGEERERFRSVARAAITAQRPKPAADPRMVALDPALLRKELHEVVAELDQLRELLDEIGVMAANAPEDGDSFGVLEEIAMRIAAADGPDSTPSDSAGPQPAPELAAAMAETRKALDRLDAIRKLCEARIRIVGMVDGKGVARKVIAIIDKPEGR